MTALPIENHASGRMLAGPPWTLRGDGYMLFFRLPEKLAREGSFAPKALQDRQVGRLSIVIVVDYQESNVGPYQEIFIAPGAYRFSDGQKYMSVTKIYVSSWASVLSGRANWGIPKEHAQFEIRREKPGLETYVASSGGKPFAEISMRSYSPGLPARSWMLPPSLFRYAQVLDGKAYGFKFRLAGTARLARVVGARFDSRKFPDLTQGRFLGGLRMSGLTMNMPVPTMLAAEPDSLRRSGGGAQGGAAQHPPA